MKIFRLASIVLVLMMMNVCKIIAQVPTWEWVKNPSGTGTIQSHAITTDPSGNVYTTGWYDDTDLTFGTTTLNYSADGDIYIVKYDNAGNVIWASNAGGNGFDESRSITTDDFGNVYVTGVFDGTDITINGIVLTNTDSGSLDLFIAKFDPNGTLLWAQSAGGPEREFAEQMTVDYTGNIYVTGSFESAILSFGGINLANVNPGDEDVYVVKYDANGNALWAKSGGGTGLDWATCVNADAFGNVTIAGPTYSDTIFFDGLPIVNSYYAAGNEGTFIMKFDSVGTPLWGKSIVGNSYFNELYGLGSDANGNLFVTGTSNSDTVVFDTLSVTNAQAGYFDMILAKYNAAGNLLWAKKTGGWGTDYGYTSDIDASGNIYIIGHFDSDTIYFDATNAVAIDPVYYSDMFIVKYNNSGDVQWAKGTGGIDRPVSYGYAPFGISLDNAGNLFAVGNYQLDSLLFDADTLFLNGNSFNSFVAKLNDAGPCSATFSLFPDSATQHLYWAVNQAYGVQPISYFWDWGDGSTDTIQYPSHTYATGGFYTICLTITDSTNCINTVCHTNSLQRNYQSEENTNTMVVVNVVPFIPTNTQEIYQQQLNVFPNPANNQFTITLPEGLKKYELYITDLLGKVWMRQYGVGVRKLDLNATQLPGGIYFLNLKADDFFATEKLIVTD